MDKQLRQKIFQAYQSYLDNPIADNFDKVKLECDFGIPLEDIREIYKQEISKRHDYKEMYLETLDELKSLKIKNNNYKNKLIDIRDLLVRLEYILQFYSEPQDNLKPAKYGRDRINKMLNEIKSFLQD